jgi:hypothetical protein
MIRFTTKILQFGEMGEKTGWSYIRVSADLAAKLLPGNKKSFRVKGKLDEQAIEKMALLPMGEGDFILALKASVRKSLRKQKGDSLRVELEVDKAVIKPPKDLMECLADEPAALAYFSSLPKSHQNYFGNWVREAKTDHTRTKRLSCVVEAMAKRQNFGEMLRARTGNREGRLG